MKSLVAPVDVPARAEVRCAGGKAFIAVRATTTESAETNIMLTKEFGNALLKV